MLYSWQKTLNKWVKLLYGNSFGIKFVFHYFYFLLQSNRTCRMWSWEMHRILSVVVSPKLLLEKRGSVRNDLNWHIVQALLDQELDQIARPPLVPHGSALSRAGMNSLLCSYRCPPMPKPFQKKRCPSVQQALRSSAGGRTARFHMQAPDCRLPLLLAHHLDL